MSQQRLWRGASLWLEGTWTNGGGSFLVSGHERQGWGAVTVRGFAGKPVAIRSEKGTGESLMSNKEGIGTPGMRRWGGASKLFLLDSAHAALSTQQALRRGWVCDFWPAGWNCGLQSHSLFFRCVFTKSPVVNWCCWAPPMTVKKKKQPRMKFRLKIKRILMN